MKLIFFLIAFCLVSFRVYLSWSGIDKEKRGMSESNMVIRSDNFNEEIKYSGKFQFNEDETAFKSISPGGYFKFRRNDESVKAESNLKGEIEYAIYDGKNNLGLDDQGKKLLATAIREMFNWGFDATARMERIYQKGGIRAVLSEVDSVKTDQVKFLYINRLLTIDSLSVENISLLTTKIASMNSDMDKLKLLNRISPWQLKDPQIALAYFNVLNGLTSDRNKSDALGHLLDDDTISDENIFRILQTACHLNSDMDKSTVFHKMISKNIVNSNIFDSLLILIPDLRTDMDKKNLYVSLLEVNNISENQWINLMSQITAMNSDMDKSDLLIEIASKMPKTGPVKESYLKAAKSIGNDRDYGRALRAIQ